MEVVKVKFSSWDKSYNFLPGDLDIKVGDQVIVDTELGKELGVVLAREEVARSKEEKKEEKEIKSVLRLAEKYDLDKGPDKKTKKEALKYCYKIIKKHNLPMKLVDVHFSYSGGRMNFAFIADGRVDFRDLVKELTMHFNTNIRLTQIGTRDEAKIDGDFGPCGRRLCCKSFIGEFSSITSEMAESQQVVHRGSERISGMCNRLMCCLAFEHETYKNLAKKMPAIGTRVSVDGRKGVVVGHHILKQSVRVEFKPEKGERGRTFMEVDLDRKNKKKE